MQYNPKNPVLKDWKVPEFGHPCENLESESAVEYCDSEY